MSTSSLIRAISRELQTQFPNNAPSFQLVQKAVSNVLESNPKELNLYNKLFDSTLIGRSSNEPYIVNVIYDVQTDAFSVATCIYGYSCENDTYELQLKDTQSLHFSDAKMLKKFEKNQRKFSFCVGYDVLWIQQSTSNQELALQQSVRILADFPPHRHIGVFNFSFTSALSGDSSSNEHGIGVSIMSYYGPYLPISFRYHVGFIDSVSFNMATATSTTESRSFKLVSDDRLKSSFRKEEKFYAFEYMSVFSEGLDSSSLIYSLMHRELEFNFDRLKGRFTDNSGCDKQRDIPLYGYESKFVTYKAKRNLTQEEKLLYPSKYQALAPSTRFSTDFFKVKKGPRIIKRLEIKDRDGATNVVERTVAFQKLLTDILPEKSR